MTSKNPRFYLRFYLICIWKFGPELSSSSYSSKLNHLDGDVIRPKIRLKMFKLNWWSKYWKFYLRKCSIRNWLCFNTFELVLIADCIKKLQSFHKYLWKMKFFLGKSSHNLAIDRTQLYREFYEFKKVYTDRLISALI